MGGATSTIELGRGRFRVKRQIGEGGFAYVYVVEDEGKKFYALKRWCIAADSNDEEARKEQEILKSLAGFPYVVKHYDSGVIREAGDSHIRNYYILMEYCPVSVVNIIEEYKMQGMVMPEDLVLKIFHDVSLALLFLHSQDPPIAHRDLKVENVLRSYTGAFKLCDFGSCTTHHKEYTDIRETTLMQDEVKRHTTPAYRAPEQVDLFTGKLLCEKVDVWAAGVLLYKLLTFKTPFEDVHGNVEPIGITNGVLRYPSTFHHSNEFKDLVAFMLVVCPYDRPSVLQTLHHIDDMHDRGLFSSWKGWKEEWLQILEGFDHIGRRSSLTSLSSGGSQGNYFDNDGDGNDAMSAQNENQLRARVELLSETVQTRVMKMVGREKQKYLVWILKATSKRPGKPKPKYVRRLVLAIWEDRLTIPDMVKLMRDRPYDTNRVVSIKIFVTILKILSQGPPRILSECMSLIPLLDDLSRTWSRGRASGAEQGGVNLMNLLTGLAIVLMQKLNFHVSYPYFNDIFTSLPYQLSRAADPTLSDESIPFMSDQEVLGSGRDALSSLLTIQELWIEVTQQILTIVADGNCSVELRETVSTLCLPVLEESYLVFLAATFLLSKLFTLTYDGSEADESISTLHNTYNEQLETLRHLYRRADSVSDVRQMNRTPHLPTENPIAADGSLRVSDIVPSSMRSRGGLENREEILQSLREEELSDYQSNPTLRRSYTSVLEDDEIHDHEAHEERGPDAPERAAAIKQEEVVEGWADFSGVTEEMTPSISAVSNRHVEASWNHHEGVIDILSPARSMSIGSEDEIGFQGVIEAAQNQVTMGTIPTIESLGAQVEVPLQGSNHVEEKQEVVTEEWLKTEDVIVSIPPRSQQESIDVDLISFETVSVAANRRKSSQAVDLSATLQYSVWKDNHDIPLEFVLKQPWIEKLNPFTKMALDEMLNAFQELHIVHELEWYRITNVIGSGAFAIVFGAESLKTRQKVAIKKLTAGEGYPMDKTIRDFRTEVELMHRLDHVNIVSLVGTLREPVGMIMEFCANGNLFQALADKSIPISESLKKRMATDVAQGMNYLHSQVPMIIHRDLKSLNLLVDEEWRIKVTDFGLSRFKAHSMSARMTGQAGTYHWMAPEVMNSEHYTEKADVYSFGIILWEIYTRAVPFEDYEPVQIVAAVLNRKERPPIPADCSDVVSSLIRSCWQQESHERPSFAAILEILDSL